MIKKIIIAITIAIIILGIFVYFGKDKTLIDIISPDTQTSVSSGTIETQTGMTQTGKEWDPRVMRREPTIQAGSGVTVTVSTNGPAVRTMTPEETKEFQKKMQGK